MSIFRKTKFNIKNLYVVTTGNSDYTEDSGIFIKHYEYNFSSISVVSLKNSNKKTCKDVVSGRKYYIFDDNASIDLSRIYCSDIRPLYKFLMDDNRYKNIFKSGTITLDELCMFLTEMNNYFYDNVLNHTDNGCYA